MSVRWMAVQYVGNTLILPIANAEDMSEPVGTSVTERDVSRVIVNTSAGRKTFVPDGDGDRMRELVWDLYCLAYPMAVDYETSCYVEDKYKPCSMCQSIHGKAPCASTSRDMADELCKRIQAALVAESMKALGIEV